MLDYRLIEALAAVLDEGGFDRAATRLCITQPAVSHRIKQLEDEVGRALVVRESPPRATPAGERLLRHYRQVTSLESEAIGDLGLDQRRQFQRLAVAVNADSLAIWFLDAVAPVLRDRAAALEIIVDDQDRTLRFLRAGEAAACVSAEKSVVQGFSMTKIGDMRVMLVASPAYVSEWFGNGIDRAGAERAPIVIFNRWDQLHNRCLLRLFGVPQLSPPAYHVPATDKYIDFIVDGYACGMVPEIQAAPLIDDGLLVELDGRARLTMPLYWYRWNSPSVLLQRLTDLVVREGGRILRAADGDGAGA